MNTLPTAREFYDNHYSDDCVIIMIDYAKLHVDAQLTCILEKIELIEYMRTNNTIIKTPFDKECDFYINKDSILNAYPLTNIK